MDYLSIRKFSMLARDYRNIRAIRYYSKLHREKKILGITMPYVTFKPVRNERFKTSVLLCIIKISTISFRDKSTARIIKSKRMAENLSSTRIFDAALPSPSNGKENSFPASCIMLHHCGLIMDAF